MKYGVYSILDKAAEEFGPVYQSHNDAVARRRFDMLLSDLNVAFPDDFKLFKLGEFDNSTGILTGFDKPEEVYFPKDDEIQNLRIREVK